MPKVSPVYGVDDASPPHRPFIDRLDRDAATYQYHAAFLHHVLIDLAEMTLANHQERVVAAADEYISNVSLALAERQVHHHASRLRYHAMRQRTTPPWRKDSAARPKT